MARFSREKQEFQRNKRYRQGRERYIRVGALRDKQWEAISKVKNGSEGILPVEDFNDLNIRFLILEIRLREGDGVRHFQVFDFIQAYWKTWLNMMNNKDTKFS